MIMTEPNVIDMCNVYEPRVPRERPRDRGEHNRGPGPFFLLLLLLAWSTSLPTWCTTSGRLTLVLDNVNPEVEPGIHLFERAMICMAMKHQTSRMTMKHAGV